MTAFFTREDGVALAYEMRPGRAPVVVFLPGFASDMGGTKALALRDACHATGQAMLRLDYSGHGESGGDFKEGSIRTWAADAALVIGAAAGDAPLLLVGSSMGGWIALLLARQYAARVAAMLLVAPAPDFTAAMIEPNLTAAQRQALAQDGCFYPPGADGPPAPITRKLLEDGRAHLLLGGPIAVTCKMRILHGMKDFAVPWEQSLKLVDCLESEDVQVNFIKDGDHRLSREQDLGLLIRTLTALLGEDRA